jgi:hypothetical protein
MGYVVPKNFTEHYGKPPDGVLVNSNNAGLNGHPPLSNFAPRIGVAWQPGKSGKLGTFTCRRALGTTNS